MYLDKKLIPHFDTILATKKNHVAKMNVKLTPRTDHIDKNGECLLYLYLYSEGEKRNIPLGIRVPLKQWDKNKQRISTKGISLENSDVNLMLDNVMKRITEVKTLYWLNKQHLSIDDLVKEYQSGFSRVDFLGFATAMNNEEKGLVAHRTYQKRASVINKIKKYKSIVLFSDINESWINGYKKFWMKDREENGELIRGNTLNTIGNDIKAIKKWLRIASNSGINLKIKLDNIKVDRTPSTREYLSKDELKKVYDYYFSDFCKPSYKLTVGYFLFACFSSLRISDVRKVNRSDFEQSSYKFKITKTNKDHFIYLNDTTMKIVDHYGPLFVEWKAETNINEDLKEVMFFLGIRKHITFHCGRHTFATNYLRMGGKVEVLQKILGHSNIQETMIYSHIVEQEKEESIFIMDKIFEE